MDVRFTAELWYWRGPSPFHFVSVPGAVAAEIAELAPMVSYGWGMIPARVSVGATGWRTALFPKDGGYVVPIRDVARRAEQLVVGRPVTVDLHIDERPPERAGRPGTITR